MPCQHHLGQAERTVPSSAARINFDKHSRQQRPPGPRLPDGPGVCAQDLILRSKDGR